MKGEIHQMVCLAAAANGTLRGWFDPKGFFPDHPAFSYCGRVEFVAYGQEPDGSYRERPCHADPVGWLTALRDRGARAVWLEYQAPERSDPPAHMMAAFAGGGGDCLMVATGPGFGEVWRARWSVDDDAASDDGRWCVTYGRADEEGRETGAPLPDSDAARQRLGSALDRIAAFAAAHAPGWETGFEKAARVLASGPTGMSAVKIPCFARYPEPARRLLGAAYGAWVFGGMGSWNDLGFEDDAVHGEYETLSADLHSAIMQAIHAATCLFVRSPEEN